jgi:hypothetical protein
VASLSSLTLRKFNQQLSDIAWRRNQPLEIADFIDIFKGYNRDKDPGTATFSRHYCHHIYLEVAMYATDATIQTLHQDLAAIQAANLTMNDRFLAEAALLSRDLLLTLMQKHECSLADITPAHIAAELRQRAPMTYHVPALPTTTSQSQQGL